jgi:hypothetical protein
LNEDANNDISLKTTLAIQGLLQDLQRGLITQAEVKTSIKTLFEAVGGYISIETYELLSQAADEVKGAVGFDVRFVKGLNGDLIGTVRVCGGKSHILKIKVAQLISSNARRVPDDMEPDVYAMLKQDEIMNGELW